MQLAELDWSLLRGSSVVLIASLAIAGGLMYGGDLLATKAQSSYDRDHARLASGRARYLTLDDEKRLIETYAPRFAKLEADGLIGEESRLSWVETLRAVAVGLKLPALRYEISSQEIVAPDYDLPEGPFKVFGTDMTLSMGLLHEGDLPAIVSALSQAAKGQFTVDGCSIVRRPLSFDETADPKRANLDVDCKLRWLLVRKPEQPR